jgi:hypothetical protein
VLFEDLRGRHASMDAANQAISRLQTARHLKPQNKHLMIWFVW